MTDKLILRWLESQLITPEQAKLLQEDLDSYKKNQSSNQIIVALSTLGAIILGIGFILFVSANWQSLSNLVKTSLFYSLTMASLMLGYFLAYHKKNLPKVGQALILLSALLFCTSIFLITQIYHVNAQHHLVVLLCLLGVIPLTLVLKSVPLTTLSTFGIYLWLILYAIGDATFDANPLQYLILLFSNSLVLFSTSSFFPSNSPWRPISRTVRLISLNFGLLLTLLFTNAFISGEKGIQEFGPSFTNTMPPIHLILIIIILVANSLRAFKHHTKDTLIECSGVIGLLVINTLFLISPAHDLFVFLYNLMFIALTLTGLVVGYQRQDIKLIDLNSKYIALYLIIRYADWFWDLLPRSLFFILGGSVLISAGIILERKKRQLAIQFEQ